MPLLIIVGVVIALVVIIGLYRDLQVKRHRRQLKEKAEQLGLSYSEEGDAKLYNQADRFLLFAQGKTGEIQNAMQGDLPLAGGDGQERVRAAIFEYTFTTPLGRYAENWRQTVLRIEDDSLDLPAFSVTPEPVFNAMLGNARDKELRDRLAGVAKVRFPAHPDFDRAIHVQGPNRGAIHGLLSDPLIALYQDSGVLCTEGSGPYLLFYRYDHLVDADELDDFVDAALAAYGHYRESESANRE